MLATKGSRDRFGYPTFEQINYVVSKFEEYYKSTTKYAIFQPEEDYILQAHVTDIRSQLANTKILESTLDKIAQVCIYRHARARCENFVGLSVGSQAAEAYGEELQKINFKGFQQAAGIQNMAANVTDFMELIRLSKVRKNPYGSIVTMDPITTFNIFDLKHELIDIELKHILDFTELVYGGKVLPPDDENNPVHIFEETLSRTISDIEHHADAIEYLLLTGKDIIYNPGTEARTFLRCSFNMRKMVEYGVYPEDIVRVIESKVNGTVVIPTPVEKQYRYLMSTYNDQDDIYVLEVYMSPNFQYPQASGDKSGLSDRSQIYINNNLVPAISNIKVKTRAISSVRAVNPVVKSLLTCMRISSTRLSKESYKLYIDEFACQPLGITVTDIAKLLTNHNIAVNEVGKDYIVSNISKDELNTRIKLYSDYVIDANLDDNVVRVTIDQSIPDVIYKLLLEQLTLIGFQNVESSGSYEITFDKEYFLISVLEDLLSITIGEEEEGKQTLTISNFNPSRDDITFDVEGVDISTVRAALIENSYTVISSEGNSITINRPKQTSVLNSIKLRLDYKPGDIIFIETVGGNLYDLMTHSLANPRLTVNNDYWDIYYNLGICAFRNFIIREVYSITVQNNISMDPRNILIIALKMASSYKPRQYNFKGVEGQFIGETDDYDAQEQEDEDLLEDEEVEDEGAEVLSEDEQEQLEAVSDDEENEETDDEEEEDTELVSKGISSLMLYGKAGKVIGDVALPGTYQATSSMSSAQLFNQIPDFSQKKTLKFDVENIMNSSQKLEYPRESKFDLSLSSSAKPILAKSTIPTRPGTIPRIPPSIGATPKVDINSIRSRILSRTNRAPAVPYTGTVIVKKDEKLNFVPVDTHMEVIIPTTSLSVPAFLL